MIMLSGLRPEEDIPIRVVGLRPGEKLHEALLNSQETFEATPHPKIQRVCCPQPLRVSEAEIEELRARCGARDLEGLRGWVAARVPSLNGAASETAAPTEEPHPG
jgi:O-antigen biosynthesis protein WbqV